MPTIQINSILGGHSPSSHFSAPDQFLGSYGIDPARYGKLLGASDVTFPTAYLDQASGLLVPVGVDTVADNFSRLNMNSTPLWMIPNPKDLQIYVYDLQGSAYILDSSNSFAALPDGGSLSNSRGNGCEYYDNYIYFAKNTTIARYGPLNGLPAFNGDYWVGTLGKTQLTDTLNYPNASRLTVPNHYLHRHSDGKLYIADVVGNQGAIHYISTKKTTVEGDTDNGSTYNALSFGAGLWPVVLESYGSDLAIALYEGSDVTSTQSRRKTAKLAFWDTVSPNFRQIIWDEFPDGTISAMKNINGSLKLISGQGYAYGFRVSTYLGGYSFREDGYFSSGDLPLPGAVIGNADRLLFGSSFAYDQSSGQTYKGCVFSLGLQKASLSRGLFNVMPCSGSAIGVSAIVTAIAFREALSFLQYDVYAGWSTITSASVGIDISSNNFLCHPFWMSQLYRIGKRFKVNKINIPLYNPVETNVNITVEIYTDTFNSKYTLAEINDTNYHQKRNIVYRPTECLGYHDLVLKLTWTGSALCPVSLPIEIDYEFVGEE